jgi:hypothetical protein
MRVLRFAEVCLQPGEIKQAAPGGKGQEDLNPKVVIQQALISNTNRGQYPKRNLKKRIHYEH